MTHIHTNEARLLKRAIGRIDYTKPQGEMTTNTYTSLRDSLKELGPKIEKASEQITKRFEAAKSKHNPDALLDEMDELDSKADGINTFGFSDEDRRKIVPAIEFTRTAEVAQSGFYKRAPIETLGQHLVNIEAVLEESNYPPKTQFLNKLKNWILDMMAADPRIDREKAAKKPTVSGGERAANNLFGIFKKGVGIAAGGFSALSYMGGNPLLGTGYALLSAKAFDLDKFLDRSRPETQQLTSVTSDTFVRVEDKLISGSITNEAFKTHEKLTAGGLSGEQLADLFEIVAGMSQSEFNKIKTAEDIQFFAEDMNTEISGDDKTRQTIASLSIREIRAFAKCAKRVRSTSAKDKVREYFMFRK